METRQALIEAIERDDPKRPASAIIVGELLCCWHGDGGPYDVFVFDEVYGHYEGYPTRETIKPWQQELINGARQAVNLGQRRGSSVRPTWACNYMERDLTLEDIAALKDRFGIAP
jgi:hypothetical protein